MEQQTMALEGGRPEMLERTSLCLPSLRAGVVLHNGDPGFRQEVQRHFDAAQSDAAERLLALKSRLRDESTDDFWRTLTVGMSELADAQYAFVVKRILVDDQTSAVEMPPLGEPGSCLVAEVYYYNDGHGVTDMIRNFSFQAYGAPCGHMRHDKVFLIPERFDEFINANPNEIPFPADAYMAVPLFSEGKCFAHFGLLWTPEAVRRRVLSWGTIELLLHGLEDIIAQRLVEGRSFTKKTADAASGAPGRVIPHEAILASQSLKPYARSLSHELRTPMQGVIGMLDVMHATVRESAELQTNSHVRKVFEMLRENIEVVQDSSRRAVEAADNVVHAYDMNMKVPDTPESDDDDDDDAGTGEDEPDMRRGRSSNQPRREADARRRSSNKRRRSHSLDRGGRPYSKYRAIEHPPDGSTVARNGAGRQRNLLSVEDGLRERAALETLHEPRPRSSVDRPSTPSHRPTRLKALLRSVVRDSLYVGGRPDSVIGFTTECGEDIHVRTSNSNGEPKAKLVRWMVDGGVSDSLLVDGRDVGKLISCVVLNALKFTEDGTITVAASMGSRSRQVLVRVKDTGPGIPDDFLPFLFKPFSREDDSMTRAKDGLGLGLLVAKGLARKIGGDLVCVRSHTSGPDRGTEFEIRIPVMTSATDETDDAGSRMARTPAPTPTPMVQASPDPFAVDVSLVMAGLRDKTPIPSADGPEEMEKAPQWTTATASQAPLSSILTPRICTFDHHRHHHPQQPPASNNNHNPDLATTTTHSSSSSSSSLASRHPLTFLVAEDNKINRKLLVHMLSKLGYSNNSSRVMVHEAYDGLEAVRQMQLHHSPPIDVILMDLWMPRLDGIEAARRILSSSSTTTSHPTTTTNHNKNHDNDDDDDHDDDNDNDNLNVSIIAVTADATTEALQRALAVGMLGLITKPYRLADLERVILECCRSRDETTTRRSKRRKRKRRGEQEEGEDGDGEGVE